MENRGYWVQLAREQAREIENLKWLLAKRNTELAARTRELAQLAKDNYVWDI
jgi:hypothetical protein